MSKLVVFVVRDTCGNVFGQPMFQTSVGGAERAFRDSVNRRDDSQNLLAQHPEHFELYLLGHFDQDTGMFDLLPSPRQLLLGSNCVAKAS